MLLWLWCRIAAVRMLRARDWLRELANARAVEAKVTQRVGSRAGKEEGATQPWRIASTQIKVLESSARGEQHPSVLIFESRRIAQHQHLEAMTPRRASQ